MIWILLAGSFAVAAYFTWQFLKQNKKHNKHKNAQTEWKKFEKEHPGKYK